MGAVATPPLIEQWANNLGASSPFNESWMDTIAKIYGVDLNSATGDTLSLIANRIGVDLPNSCGDLYQDICNKLGDGTPLNGSYLERIVQLTTPQ